MWNSKRRSSSGAFSSCRIASEGQAAEQAAEHQVHVDQAGEHQVHVEMQVKIKHWSIKFM